MNTRTRCVVVGTIALSVWCMPAIGQTPEELIAVRNAFAKAIDNHDIDAILSCFTEDGVHDVPVLGPPMVGREQIRAMWEDQFAGSPDWHTEEGRVLAKDNIVIVEHAAAGTNTRDTDGRSWIWPHLDIYEFEGLKIKRLTSYGDYASILVQFGWSPAPDPPDLVPSILVPDPEPTSLSAVEANGELTKRWNSHDLAALGRMTRQDAKIFAGPLAMTLDRVGVTALNEMYFQGFSDARLTPVRTIDMGNGWVVFEHVASGTHDGTFMGTPPAGYMVEIRAVWLTHYDTSGLVTEQSFYYDNLTLINQMTTPEWSPAGTWITAVPTPLGNAIMTGAWIPQDAEGTQFVGQYQNGNMLPLVADLYPDADTSKWAGALAVKVGRNKYEITFLEYEINTIGPLDEEIVGLAVLTGIFELIGPDSIAGQGTKAYYLAAQDADQDGFPDEGEEPVICLAGAWTAKRLTIMPGCTPTPVP